MYATIRSILFSMLALVVFAGCAGDHPAATPQADAAASAPSPAETSPAPPADAAADSGLAAHAGLRYECAADTDCAIKDVGNCCGAYPACVNADSPTDPEGVARECAQKGLAGICGYPVIEACVCRNARCEAVPVGQDGASQ